LTLFYKLLCASRIKQIAREIRSKEQAARQEFARKKEICSKTSILLENKHLARKQAALREKRRISKNEGAKRIPRREEAALNFKVQILQRWTRDGEWKKVGDAMEPLVKTVENKDGKTTRIACERVEWELSLGVTGMITSNFVGGR
jgi:hypothetical protein